MRRVDLNLLYILRELLKEPNTTKVGEKLGLTQSAVSASLGRLRWAFQDDLFVRSGRAMAPTKRAEGLLEPVEEIIQRIESLVEEVRFEPENLQRQFTMATTDFLLQRISGPIIAGIHPQAPQTRVIFAPFAADTRDRLRSGHLDLMMAPYVGGIRESNRIRFEPVYSDHLVAAVRSDSTRYNDVITEQQLLDAPHLEFNPGIVSGWKSTTQIFLEERNLPITPVAEFTNMATMMYALGNSDAIAILPGKVVEELGENARVKAIALPFDVPDFEVGIMWNRAFDNDPEHQWFREIVQKAVEGM